MQLQLLYFHSIHLLSSDQQIQFAFLVKHASTSLLLQLRVQEADSMFSCQHAQELLLGPGQAPHRAGKGFLEPHTAPHHTPKRCSVSQQGVDHTTNFQPQRQHVVSDWPGEKGPANCSLRTAKITQQHHPSNPKSCRTRDWIGFAGSRAVSASISLTTRLPSLKTL